MLPGDISLESYERIELGMSRRQGELILGQPSLGHVEPDYDCFFETMMAHDLKREGELWRSGSLRLWLRFDRDNRVNGKLLQWARFKRSSTPPNSGTRIISFLAANTGAKN
jgi:hypothetical protein